MKTEFNYTDSDGQRWILSINEKKNNFTVYCDGESITYKVKEKIVNTSQKDEYVYLILDNTDYYQIKFEADKFLVIDLFDKDDEFIKEVDSFVFDED